MKTEKQIYLKSLEKGQEYYELSETMDIIAINEKHQHSWFKDIHEDDTFMCIPIIPKGVFICQYPDYEGRIIFECELKDSAIVFKTTTLYIKDNICNWVCDCNYSLLYEIEKQSDFTVNNYNDATIEIYTKQKMPNKMIEDYFERNIQDKSQPFILFLRAMAWINYLMANPDKKNFIDNEDVKPRAKSSGLKSNTNNAIKIINLNNIRFKINNKKVTSKIRSKQIHRVASCWGVRGHFRHYKTGKVVYIKPYEKGTDRTKRIRKQYEI